MKNEKVKIKKPACRQAGKNSKVKYWLNKTIFTFKF